MILGSTWYPILTGMSRFDREKWIERVENSCYVSRRTRDLRAVDHLTVLVAWCQARNIEIDFRRMTGGEWDPESRFILCSSSARPEKQVYTILHEIGHWMYETRHAARSQATTEARKGSVRYAVDHLGEEYEAWNNGARVAAQLSIPLDESWECYRIECLATYIDWASSRGKGYDDD